MTDVAELLERTVPEYRGAAADWDAVLRDAGVRRRRTPLRLSLAAAVVAAAVALAVAWPFGSAPPSILDRALAAAGGGVVLHIVTETDLAKTFVDLETGERREVRGVREIWFDPARGMRQRETFEGVTQSDVSFGAAALHEHAIDVYASLGEGYREALQSGDAEVVGEDRLGGERVIWIRIVSQGARSHDVAVSAETYVPVHFRILGDGRPLETRILTYETVDRAPLQSGAAGEPPRVAEPREEISLAQAERELGRPPVWTGERGLRSVRRLDAGGVTLEYDGALITQGAQVVDAITMLVGLRGYAPPEGTLVMEGASALLRSHGLVVAIHAPDEEAMIAVARALRPVN